MKRNPLYTIMIMSTAFLVLNSVAFPLKKSYAADKDPLSQAPTIDAIIAYGIKENPAIQAARSKWRVVIETYRVQTAYPDPQVMLTVFPDPIETRLGPQDWNANISQMIPFPGKLSKKGEIVTADARIAQLKLRQTMRQVIQSIYESYHELRYIRTAIGIAEKNRGLIAHLRKIAETAHAEDRAQLMDVMKAQSQTAQLGYDILLLKELMVTEKARLNGFLNRTPDAPLGKLVPSAFMPVAYSLAEIQSLAEANLEALLIADVQKEKAALRRDLAAYRSLPDFKIGLFYAAIGEPDNAMNAADAGRDAYGIQAGMSLPIWFGKNSGAKEAAQAGIHSATAMKQEVLNQTRTNVSTLYFKLQNAMRLVTLYDKELLPQAARNMELSEIWFKEGEGSFSDFIETQAVWYNFMLAKQRAMADHGKYLARLERLAGKSLTVKKTAASIHKTDKRRNAQ